MSGLTPADLGLLDEDDNAPAIGADPSLPTASLPPRPADLRSKEGREWKKLAKDAGIDTTKPETLTGDTSRTKPGRPRTMRNVEHFKKVLLSSHEKAALLMGVEELALDDDEATMLAESITELLSYYKIKTDGKSGAVLMLGYAIMMVYGSRLLPYLIPNIVSLFKRDTPPEMPANVSTFRPNLSN